MRTLIQLHLYFLLPCFLMACSSGSSSGETQQSSFSYTEELPFCSEFRTIANPVTVQAQAQFFSRNVTSTGLQGPQPAQNIRYAEVEVLNDQGVRVQCGTTDENGQVYLDIDKIPGSYILRINSRANHEKVRASVLDSPFSNQHYKIQASFSVTSSSSILSVSLPIAPYDGSLEGGAFNILDQIFRANQFIRDNSTCTAQGNVCPSFSVAPKVQAFWKPGFSPFTYFGYPDSAVSFFSTTGDSASGIRRGLYIQGGLQGDVTCSDTDHFDNSVILHEYGHFLEDVFAQSDSPGGSHNGNFIIDPRLAWSEGWANFFQTAVLGNSVYRDTIGNSNCSGGTFLAVNLNLETAQIGQDRMVAGTQPGEGVFREVSVSRALYDIMDSGGPDGGAGVGFSYIWKVFSDTSIGLANPQNHFRSIGMFNSYMKNLVSSFYPARSPAFDTAIANEYQLSNQREYGLPLVAGNQGCSFQIQGVADTYSYGGRYSNLLKSNDFFAIQYDGSRPIIELRYTGVNPSDLDLDLYTEDYVYDETVSILRRSHNLYPEVGGGNGYESINLSGLPFGTYMINVRVNSDRINSAATYTLETPQGERFCP